MTQLPEPNFIERDAENVIREWVALYEQKTGKILQPAQIERLMIDVGAYRENMMRIEIQEVAKKNLLSYAPLEILEHIGEPLDVKNLQQSVQKAYLDLLLKSLLILILQSQKDAKLKQKTDWQFLKQPRILFSKQDKPLLILKECRKLQGFWEIIMIFSGNLCTLKNQEIQAMQIWQVYRNRWCAA